jgi:hypothetical protein
MRAGKVAVGSGIPQGSQSPRRNCRLLTSPACKAATIFHEIARSHAGLNKGEASNALRRAVFFHRQGESRDRTFENQGFRASGLSIITAAIVHWNTVYLHPADARRSIAQQPTDAATGDAEVLGDCRRPGVVRAPPTARSDRRRPPCSADSSAPAP